MKQPTILMTGVSGMLGSNLVKMLSARGSRVIALKRRNSDMGRLEAVRDSIEFYDIDDFVIKKLFARGIDIVIHCATNFGRREIDNATLLEANLILPVRLLHEACEHGVQCFINTDTILDKRVSAYSLSKSQFREWLLYYSRRIACLNVALEHFYGPMDDDSKFVTYIIRNILHGVDRIPLTPGEQKRDFIYVDDVVDAFRIIIENCSGLGSGYFNYEIGTSQTVSIREFVEMVKKLAHNTTTFLDFGAIPYRDCEVMDSTVDSSTIRDLGWVPRVSLIDGLAKTIEWERGKL